MNTAKKKTHIYTVDVRKSEHHPGLRVFVRAESKAQARSFVAATMIAVERTEQEDLLELSSSNVINAGEVLTGTGDDQPPLPLVDDPNPEPFGHDFIQAAGLAGEVEDPTLAGTLPLTAAEGAGGDAYLDGIAGRTAADEMEDPE